MSLLLLLLMSLVLAFPAAAQNRGIQRLGDELLNSSDLMIRREAARGLGRAATTQTVRILRAARTTEGHTSIRLEIVRALRRIAFQRSPGYRSALAAIGEAADDAFEANELVRLRATEALWEAGKKDLLDPVPILEQQLQDKSARLRLAAVEMLRKLGTPEAADVLGRTCQDKSQSNTVRRKSIEAVGAVALSAGGVIGRQIEATNIGVTAKFGIAPISSPRNLEQRHERQVSYLAAVVRDPQNNSTLMLRAVKSLGQVKDKSSIPVLRQLIESHQQAVIRKQATIVLSHVMAVQYE